MPMQPRSNAAAELATTSNVKRVSRTGHQGPKSSEGGAVAYGAGSPHHSEAGNASEVENFTRDQTMCVS